MRKNKSPMVVWLFLGLFCAASLFFFALGFLRYRAALILRAKFNSSALTPYSSQVGPLIYFPAGWNISRDDAKALVARDKQDDVFSIYPAGRMSESSLSSTFPLLNAILKDIFDRNCVGIFVPPQLSQAQLSYGLVYYYPMTCTDKDGAPLAVMTMSWDEGNQAYTGGIFMRNSKSDVTGTAFAILSGDLAWLGGASNAPAQALPQSSTESRR